MKFARKIATALETKGFGEVSTDGSQSFFNIKTMELLNRLEEVGISREVSCIFLLK